jgi:hypothetical protein
MKPSKLSLLLIAGARRWWDAEIPAILVADGGQIMDIDDRAAATTPDQLAAALRQNQAELAVLHHTHEGPRRSVREATYKGHRIRVVTTYEISIDDKPVSGHLVLDNDGSVHYHAIPNQQFSSMIEMVERIIDLAWNLDEPQPDVSGPEHRHIPGGHHHDHPGGG